MKRLEISNESPRYFMDQTGQTFVPVGINLCFSRFNPELGEAEVLATYRRWLTGFAANGGNFIRLWLSASFFEIMPKRIGEYDDKQMAHVKAVVAMAEELNIKVKFTFEHFRSVMPREEAESFPGAAAFNREMYQSVAEDMHQYLTSPECRRIYLERVRRFAEAGLGDSPAAAVWELWNEIECIGSMADVVPWCEYMIPELEKIFPNQLIVTSLGSFSSAWSYQWYTRFARLKGNAFLQVHRYLDPGAELDVCRGPVDVLAADSVQTLLSMRGHRGMLPVLLAESGAVEANHSSFSRWYEFDTEGTILHDVLFAPFFAGAAGCGQAWHWDHIYVDRHNLWHHFARFVRALHGLDPAAENFEPYYTETRRLRVYGLRGKHGNLMWCRDKLADYSSELAQKIPATIVTNEVVPLERSGRTGCYQPWIDQFTEPVVTDNQCHLPEFRRSIVIYNRA